MTDVPLNQQDADSEEDDNGDEEDFFVDTAKKISVSTWEKDISWFDHTKFHAPATVSSSNPDKARTFMCCYIKTN